MEGGDREVGYEVVVEASTVGGLFPAMGGLRLLGFDAPAAGSGIIVSAVAVWHSSCRTCGVLPS